MYELLSLMQAKKLNMNNKYAADSTMETVAARFFIAGKVYEKLVGLLL